MRHSLLCLFLLLVTSSILLSQETPKPILINSDGGALTPSIDHCISPEVMELTRMEIELNIEKLRKAEKLSIEKSATPVEFIWPVRQAAGYDYPNYYSIVNYVDQDPDAGEILDYECGNHTYDGHNGVDISAFPFWWDMMENDQVEVIAAAAGTIVLKYDNITADQQCDASQTFWNAFYIEHMDGTVSIYGHLKYGSLNGKGVGDQVAEGEYLGIMGSSGRSSNPHLHFEVWDNWTDRNILEPFAGSCNSLNTNSMWKNQKPYWDSKLNQVFTHFPQPTIGFCPNQETMNIENHFDPGGKVFVGLYFNKEQMGDVTNVVALDADGYEVYNFDHIAPNDNRFSYWVYELNMPTNGANGEFQIKATYKGQVVTHDFYVGVDECTVDNEVSAANLYFGEFVQSQGELSTSGLVNILSDKQVTFQSNDNIILNPGFEVWADKVFLAQIHECYPVD